MFKKSWKSSHFFAWSSSQVSLILPEESSGTFFVENRKKTKTRCGLQPLFERERERSFMEPQQTYVSESTIPQSGQGLFAIRRIKRGSVIAEFKGRLLKPTRSTILFSDRHKFSCDEADQASFANDCICVPLARRKLTEALRSTTTPFFQLHHKETQRQCWRNAHLQHARSRREYQRLKTELFQR
jgi:hypothetical protein